MDNDFQTTKQCIKNDFQTTKQWMDNDFQTTKQWMNNLISKPINKQTMIFQL